MCFRQDKRRRERRQPGPDVAPRLSLVVLPFANLNIDPDQDYFADSITTDLTTDLAQMPDAFVIGRGTAFAYKNKQIDLKALGKELSIRWAVQGAVRRSGDQVRVNVSLADIPTGQAIWRIVLMATERISLPCRTRSQRDLPGRSTLN